jgi:hypothetical protein
MYTLINIIINHGMIAFGRLRYMVTGSLYVCTLWMYQRTELLTKWHYGVYTV